MSDKVIASLEQVTSEWLTAVLTHSRALTQGSVVAFTADTGSGNWSSNARLSLHYSAGAQGDCPATLFLKLVNTDTGDGEYFLPAEVTYYTRDYVDVPAAPLLRCYDAAHDAARRRYHLLLDDVSATHTDARAITPTPAHASALAEALAILHAHWWGEARLKQIGAPFHDAAHIKRFVDIGRPGVPHVLAVFGDRLKPHWPELMAQLFARLPERLAARAQDRTHLTLIHADPNPGNMLVPRVGERPLYLIDQQPFDWSLTTWFGVYDLAYVMALYWPSERRRALEIRALRHYHKTLGERGVQGYSWDRLYDDYRLCVALTVPVAVEYMRGGGDPDWNEFRYGLVQRTLTACDDLACRQIL